MNLSCLLVDAWPGTDYILSIHKSAHEVRGALNHPSKHYQRRQPCEDSLRRRGYTPKRALTEGLAFVWKAWPLHGWLGRCMLACLLAGAFGMYSCAAQLSSFLTWTLLYPPNMSDICDNFVDIQVASMCRCCHIDSFTTG